MKNYGAAMHRRARKDAVASVEEGSFTGWFNFYEAACLGGWGLGCLLVACPGVTGLEFSQGPILSVALSDSFRFQVLINVSALNFYPLPDHIQIRCKYGGARLRDCAHRI